MHLSKPDEMNGMCVCVCANKITWRFYMTWIFHPNWHFWYISNVFFMRCIQHNYPRREGKYASVQKRSERVFPCCLISPGVLLFTFLFFCWIFFFIGATQRLPLENVNFFHHTRQTVDKYFLSRIRIYRVQSYFFFCEFAPHPLCLCKPVYFS